MFRFGAVLSVVLVAIGLLAGGVLASSLVLVIAAIGVAALAGLLLVIAVIFRRDEIFGDSAAGHRAGAKDGDLQLIPSATEGQAAAPPAGESASAALADAGWPETAGRPDPRVAEFPRLAESAAPAGPPAGIPAVPAAATASQAGADADVPEFYARRSQSQLKDLWQRVEEELAAEGRYGKPRPAAGAPSGVQRSLPLPVPPVAPVGSAGAAGYGDRSGNAEASEPAAAGDAAGSAGVDELAGLGAAAGSAGSPDPAAGPRDVAWVAEPSVPGDAAEADEVSAFGDAAELHDVPASSDAVGADTASASGDAAGVGEVAGADTASASGDAAGVGELAGAGAAVGSAGRPDPAAGPRDAAWVAEPSVPGDAAEVGAGSASGDAAELDDVPASSDAVGADKASASGDAAEVGEVAGAGAAAGSAGRPDPAAGPRDAAWVAELHDVPASSDAAEADEVSASGDRAEVDEPSVSRAAAGGPAQTPADDNDSPAGDRDLDELADHDGREDPAEVAATGPDAASPDVAAPGAGPASVAGAANGARGQVTLVPGIARYHRSGCILIRFLGADDLESMTIQAAEAGGCVPCRACRPDTASAETSS